MADTPPISTNVPETVTVDTGADQESVGSINESFADFWHEQDSKSETEAPKEAPEAPAAPGDEGAPKETPEAERQPEPATDADIDALEMTPSATPELIDNFKKLKQAWKADRAKMRSEEQRVSKLEGELTEARKNAWTPEARADYEHAAQVRRKFDVVSDPEFLQRYHGPVQAQYESILEEAIGVLPDRQAATDWANYIKANYQPDQLNREWWLNSVVNKVPNELERQSLLQSVTQLLKLQKERDGELHRRSSDKSAFDNWVKEKTETTASRVQEEIMTEIGIQEQRIKEVLPRNIDEAKTKEEREAIAAHNERFEKLNGFFKETMQDLSKHGPRAWVRASVEATRALLLEQQYKELEKELKSVKSERDKYKTEIDKIAGARRKLSSSTTGTPPASGQKKEGLSIRNLDVRKSFENYDWGDAT